MYLELYLADYVSAFIQWGFLMAFLYALVSGINNTNKSLIYLAAIMLCSYFLSDLLSLLSNIYLNWLLYDLITVAIIILVTSNHFIPASKASSYLIVGLLLNACLTTAIYYDLYIVWNTEEWWFWSVYSLGVNVIDLMMICALVINRDFLGLIKLKDFLFGTLKNAKISLRS
jgi:hypothetical protein